MSSRKLIYVPTGRASEWSGGYACNLYKGCSNNCDYCYNKFGNLRALGGPVPELKTGYSSPDEELEQFRKEVIENEEEIMNGGGDIFFNFVSDPCLPETIGLNFECIYYTIKCTRIHCTICTKCAWWVDGFLTHPEIDLFRSKVKFGFTLTGCDDKEHGISSNLDRIQAMKKLHENGFYVWSSIEPIIDLDKSFDMVQKSKDYCDLFKMNTVTKQKRGYSDMELLKFLSKVYNIVPGEKIRLGYTINDIIQKIKNAH